MSYDTYRCYIRSAHGMWTSYDGYIDITAPSDTDDDEIFQKAIKRLSQTSFPDRPSLSSWILESVEKL